MLPPAPNLIFVFGSMSFSRHKNYLEMKKRRRGFSLQKYALAKENSVIASKREVPLIETKEQEIQVYLDPIVIEIEADEEIVHPVTPKACSSIVIQSTMENTFSSNITCPTCFENLSPLSIEDRYRHANACLEENVEVETKTTTTIISNPNEEKEGFSCSICQHVFGIQTLKFRISHVKKCGKFHGLRAQDFIPENNQEILNENEMMSTTSKILPLASSKNPFDTLMHNARLQSIMEKRKVSTPIKKNISGLVKRKEKHQGWCPEFKKVHATSPPIIVDGFQFSHPKLSPFYLLTHFHADHYGGLTKHFADGTIFCTPITARLVQLRLGVNP